LVKRLCISLGARAAPNICYLRAATFAADCRGGGSQRKHNGAIGPICPIGSGTHRTHRVNGPIGPRAHLGLQPTRSGITKTPNTTSSRQSWAGGVVGTSMHAIPYCRHKPLNQPHFNWRLTFASRSPKAGHTPDRRNQDSRSRIPGADPGLQILYPGPGILDPSPRSRFLDPGSLVLDSVVPDPSSWIRKFAACRLLASCCKAYHLPRTSGCNSKTS